MKRHISERRTETLIEELLRIRGWVTSKPPKGQVLQQNEYRAFPELEMLFKKSSKRGSGYGYPEFIVLQRMTNHPRLVIEAKADETQFESAMQEAQSYAEACLAEGIPVLAIAIAGQESTTIRIGVFKWNSEKWMPIVHQGIPISWIPTPEDADALLANVGLFDLAPVVPHAQVLAEKADLINRILRESGIKDEYRPAYVGAMMLALWQSKGELRKSSRFVLNDINQSCEEAFKKASKFELANSLHIDEANSKLSARAWEILATLEKLNVVSASFEHDYLGQLYETFFRYTGGNTIGQYFTPRHITRFMADLTEVTNHDIVIDPACGTGGFLIACIQRVYDELNVQYEDVIKMIRNNLIGYEVEPVTAALCVANMILRGDGTTGIRKADCFVAPDFPISQADVALMNHPFPHKQTDASSESFIERALASLKTRGKLAVIVPTSFLVKKNIGTWRQKILSSNTLLSVCQLPDDIFQPYSSVTTSIILIEKGVPHNPKRKTMFVRLQYDGLILKKKIRVPRFDGRNQIAQATDAIINKTETPGFASLTAISGDDEWAVGRYIISSLPDMDELKVSIDELIRRLVSFYVRYAPEIYNQRQNIIEQDVKVTDYRTLVSKRKRKNAQALSEQVGTIGGAFEIYYGQKEYHSREGIPPGDSLMISPTEQYNGCYGWLAIDELIQPPFITVAQTGSIGEAFVQREACAVNDDCLILLPREDTMTLADLVIAAATIRLEKWRFSYGRKLTPGRIVDFPLIQDETLTAWTNQQLDNWLRIAESGLQQYADEVSH